MCRHRSRPADAPAEVRIYREEVYRAIRKENEEAVLRQAGSIDMATAAWQSQRDKH